MREKDIHGAVEMLKGKGFRVAERHILPRPFLHSSFRIGGQGAIGDHGEDGPLDRGGEVPIFEGFREKGGNTDLLPEGPQQIGAAQWCALDEGKRGCLSFCRFRRDKTGETADEAPYCLDIKAVLPPEGVENLRFGTPVFSSRTLWAS